MSSVHPDLQWWLDNGGREAIARLKTLDEILPDGCPADTAASPATIEASPASPAGAGSPAGIGVAAGSLDGLPVSGPPRASERGIRASSLSITFHRRRGGSILAFEVEGHARFGEPGQDIVCAGVSALAQAALLGLQEFAEDCFTSEVRPGFLGVRMDKVLGWDALEAAIPILRTLELGLRAISAAYPGWLSIKEEVP